MHYDMTVIIPTLNESENIEEVVTRIDGILSDAGITGQVLVLDDDSTDDTPDKVFRMIDDGATRNTLNLISRFTNKGLSQSIVEGVYFAEADIVLVTDADMSHDITKIPDLYHAVRSGYDIAIGSRYMKGGSVEDWPLVRKAISYGANSLARFFFPTLTDPVSGFFAIRRDLIWIDPHDPRISNLEPRGYKILFEILAKCQWVTAIEIPYTFTDRKKGSSKLSGNITKYIAQLCSITTYSLDHRNNRPWFEMEKFFRFLAVGVSGIVVNMAILFTLTEWFHVWYIQSAAVGIAVSIVSNFWLNDHWTFGKQQKVKKQGDRFAWFATIAIGGLLINISVLGILTSADNIWYMYSNFVGILAAFLWNFVMNRRVTFKEKLC